MYHFQCSFTGDKSEIWRVNGIPNYVPVSWLLLHSTHMASELLAGAAQLLAGGTQTGRGAGGAQSLWVYLLSPFFLEVWGGGGG